MHVSAKRTCRNGKHQIGVSNGAVSPNSAAHYGGHWDKDIEGEARRATKIAESAEVRESIATVSEVVNAPKRSMKRRFLDLGCRF